MLRTIALTLVALFIALFGGAWSLNYTLDRFDGFGRMTINQWEAFPQAGTLDADPYAQANTAKHGQISLGRAEGLRFQLWNDSHEHALDASCSYILKGKLPEASFFTLYSIDKSQQPYISATGLPFELSSSNIIRNQDNSVDIIIAASAHEGNWLATNKTGQYGLILTLYNTPIATTTVLQNIEMPSVSSLNEASKRCD